MLKQLTFFILLISSLSFSQGLKTKGKIIVDENENEVLLRGYTPGGWLVMEGYMMQSEGTAGAQHEFVERFTDLVGEDRTNQFFAKWRENHFMQEDVDSLASWGFNSIRVPLHYNLFTLPIQEEPNADQNTWLETGFEIIDNVLSWAEPHKMYVILDMHAAPGGQGRNSEISDYDPSKPCVEGYVDTQGIWVPDPCFKPVFVYRFGKTAQVNSQKELDAYLAERWSLEKEKTFVTIGRVKTQNYV